MAFGTNDNSLNIIISAKDQASKVIQDVRGQVDKMKPTFQKMAAVGTAAFVAVTAVAYKSLKAYAEVERSQRQLEHAVIAVSKGTKEQVKQIEDITNALEKKAGVDADALKMGAAQLSTFGLSSKAVVNLTKSLADLTVNQSGLNATSEDYIGSANTIAKALNGQFGILEKSGIRFTEAQQRLIQYGTETQKVAALQEGFAQNLRETTDTVGGVDLAMAQMQRTQENIQENLGRALVPAFNRLLSVLSPIISRFADWAEAHPELFSNILIITGVVGGLSAVVGIFGAFVLPTAITAIGSLGTALKFLAANPMVLIGAALAFIILKFGELIEVTGSFQGAIDEMGETLIRWWKNIGEWIIEKLDKLGNAFSRVIEKAAGIGIKPGSNIAEKLGIKARAQGGPVNAGDPYIVGEKGPEFFVPSRSGRIVPNEEISSGGRAVSTGAAATGANFTVIIQNPQVRSQADLNEMRNQFNDVMRDLIRVHKLKVI